MRLFRADELEASRDEELEEEVRRPRRRPGRAMLVRIAALAADVRALGRAPLTPAIRRKLERALAVELSSPRTRGQEQSTTDAPVLGARIAAALDPAELDVIVDAIRPRRYADEATNRIDAAQLAARDARARAGFFDLAVADARGAREMMSRMAELGAPAGAIDDLAAALPPHVAGPALGRSPGPLPAPIPGGPGPALAAAVERRGAAIYRLAEREDGDRDHPAVQAALARRGAGAPLPDALRTAMETRFHTQFDRVRIHTDSVAAEACSAVGARAFTVGEDIFFAPGMFASGGDELIAHELTHVVQSQQGRTAAGGMSQRGDALESEAVQTAARVTAGGEAAVESEPSAEPAAPGEAHEPAGVDAGTLLRDEKTAIDNLTASWIKATPFAITKGGAITGSILGTKVKVQAPMITAKSDVTMTLPDDKKLGSLSIKVGPIQTLMSSHRRGVYQKDGKTVNDDHDMGQTRDAAERAYADDADLTPSPVADAPFYSGNTTSGPVAASQLDVWSGDGSTFHSSVVLQDQPGFTLPAKLPTGEQLVRIEGSDQFNTSAGFKTSKGDITALAPFGWTMAWDTPIAADGTATPDPKRDAITTQPASEAVVMDTPEYANLLARQEFDSLDDAMKQPGWTLLRILPSVRTRNPKSGGFIEQALIAKNPTFKVMVYPMRGVGQKDLEKDGVGDDVTVLVTGIINKTGTEHSVSARQGTGNSVTITLNEMADVTKITEASTLNVNVHEAKHMGGNAEIAFPFLGEGSIGQNEASEGDYRVVVSAV